MNSERTINVDAEPYVYEFEPAHCALLIIDMQRDFLEPGGFGEMLGNDVSSFAGPLNRTGSCWPRGVRRA